MSLNPNATAFDPTAKPFIPAFLRNDPVDTYVPPIYGPGPAFPRPLGGLGVGAAMGDDDIPLVSGFKRTTKPVMLPTDQQDAPTPTSATHGSHMEGMMSPPTPGARAAPPAMMWRPPHSSLPGSGAGNFPTRPTPMATAASGMGGMGASLNAGASGRVNSHASLSSGGGQDTMMDKAEQDQPPIMGWSASSSMRRQPSTSPAGSPLGMHQPMQQQQQLTPTSRYTVQQQQQQQPGVPAQLSPSSLARQQERGGLSMGAAPYSPVYAGQPGGMASNGPPSQPHSPSQIVPPQPRQQQQQQQQAQQQSFPSKIAPAVPRSQQERLAAQAAAAAAASGAGTPSNNASVNASSAAPSASFTERQPSSPGSQPPIPLPHSRVPSSPAVPAPRSEAQQQQQQQQHGSERLASPPPPSTAQPPAPASRAGAVPSSDAQVSMPPRISSAPMSRQVRVGVASMPAPTAYSPNTAAVTAPPYPGVARGLVPPHATSPPPALPRAPPVQVAAAAGAPSSTASQPSPLPSSSSAQGSPAAASPLVSRHAAGTPTTAPAPRPAGTGGLTGWRPPQFGRKASPTNASPLVVLVFGCRGSGKTTQAENIAERYHLLHLSSGDMYKDGKQPYVEVEQAVRDHFGPDAKDRQYNGIVLDRFVATGEMDAYYLQAALNVCNMPVPIVFWLQLDTNEGLKRAQQRNDSKAGADHWRYVEQRAQAEVADRVYKKIGVLHAIDCNAIDARRVWDRIHSIIDGIFPTRSRNIRLPFATPIPGYEEFHLLDDFSDFQQLTREVHAAIGNVGGRTDSVPLSSIGGYVDASSFANRNECKKMSSMYVTLKVDGQRFLIVKHSHFGVLGFPFSFTGCYDFNVLFDPLSFPSAFEMLGARQGDETVGIEWMLDAELSTVENADKKPTPVLHIIDFIFFGGKQAKRTPFAERYELLSRFFKIMRDNSGNAGSCAAVVLKKYVPINELAMLLPRIDDASFAVDGIVFQANSVYKFGLDKFLLKWKPRELCTADFRLMNSTVIPEEGNTFTTVFELFTTDNEKEVAYPGAKGVFSEMEVRGFQLRHSVIAELQLEDVQEPANANGHPETVWRLHRLRADKPRPNKTAVVDSIVKLKHLTYDELLKQCSALSFAGQAKN